MGAETLIAGRLLQYAGASVVFGSAPFFLYATRAPTEVGDSTRWPWQRRLLLGAGLSALLGACVWLVAETVTMSGDTADATRPAALWMVASETRFGLACCVRIALLLVAVAACFAIHRPKPLWWVQATLGGAITLSFAWTGHGAAKISQTAGIHLAADLLHLLGAGIWIGALVPLTVLGLRARRSGTVEDAQGLRFALNEFSRIGVWVVIVLVASGILNSIFLLDLAHWRETLDSPYGKMLFVKLAIFVGMLGFAVLHRYRTTPALDAALELRTSLVLPVKSARSSLVMETALAALVLAAVSVLGTLAPPDVQASHSPVSMSR